MRAMNVAGKLLGAVAAVGIAAVAGPMVVGAAIPHSATGVITACYRSINGQLRLIDAEAGQTCATNEQTVTWNQAGPQGLRGIQGPQGPQGSPGLPGAAASVDMAAWQESFSIAPGQSRATVSCADGWEATGGGYLITAYPIDIEQPTIEGSGLSFTDDVLNHPKAWFVQVFNRSETTASIRGSVWVLCIRVANT